MSTSRIIRIRQDDKVLGYLRTEGGRNYFSKDLSGWSGKEVEFNLYDRCTGIRDKNNRLLFEHDIVTFRQDETEMILETGYDEQLQQFFMKDMNGEDYFSQDWMLDQDNSRRLEWLSFTFIQDV